MEKGGPSYTVGRNVNWFSHYEEEHGGSLKNYKQSYHMIQQSHSWAYNQEKKHDSKGYSHPYVTYSAVYNSQHIKPI